MLGWTLGGYPSPNLEIAHRFNRRCPFRASDEVLDSVARDRFGPDAAPRARKAWTAFSEAFTEYPFHITVVYTAPVQTGPANLLYPTKDRAGGQPWSAFRTTPWTNGEVPIHAVTYSPGSSKRSPPVGKRGLAELERAVEKTPSREDALPPRPS